MQSIILSDISKYIGSKQLFTSLSAQINPGEKYGLIGPNGCGKTTLLNILVSRDTDFNGSIQGLKGLAIGYVPQNPLFEDAVRVREVVLAEYRPLIRELRRAEELLAIPEQAGTAAALDYYQKARDAYDQARVDEILSRMEGVLHALGLPDKLNKPVADLSGGEKNLLSLATALIKQPDLLLLDEPGNHLDFQGLAWFEEFLKQYKNTVIMVSHNRFLLDRVCTQILEMKEGGLHMYKGNYSVYRMEQLKQQTAAQADFKANQRRLLQLEQVVKRFEEYARRTADPAWGKRLRARKKQLSREQAQAVENPLHIRQRIRVALDAEASKATIALDIKEYSKAFGDLVLFDKAQLEIQCGEKVGLLGPNGCGKTTLIRDIVRNGNWNHSQIRIGPSLEVGYMAQAREGFNPGHNLEDVIRSLGPLSRNDAFSLLSRFLFTWHDLEKRVGELSGGEFNRLQLAVLAYRKPNFLILDEPTNHMDIQAAEVVEEAICDFQGTLLVISHDRYFLDKVVDRIVEVRQQQLLSCSGSFAEYWLETFGMQQRSRGTLSGRGSERRRKTDKMPDRREADLEQRVSTAEREKIQLEKQVDSAFRQGDHQQGRKLAARLEKLVKRIEKLYTEWESLA